MDRVILLKVAYAAGLTVEIRGDSLRIRGKRAAGDIAKLLIARKAEILAMRADGPTPLASGTAWPRFEKGRLVRWTEADERGLATCRECGGPFFWGEITEDTKPAKKRQRLMKRDPDGSPHECHGKRADRFVDMTIQPGDLPELPNLTLDHSTIHPITTLVRAVLGASDGADVIHGGTTHDDN